MNFWYVSAQDNMFMRVADVAGKDRPLEEYVAAWVDPNNNKKASKETIELLTITLWIEAAAVGADPDTLPDPTRWDWDVMKAYMTALGVAFSFDDSDDWKLCWDGLDGSEVYEVSGIRHGIIGALARFAWQDPEGWLAHVAGGLSPYRICETEKEPTLDLGLVAWWPPGEWMEEYNWEAGDDPITETQPKRYRGKQTPLGVLKTAEQLLAGMK